MDLKHAARAVLHQARPLQGGGGRGPGRGVQRGAGRRLLRRPQPLPGPEAALLRDIHDLGEAHPDDRRLARWAAAVKAVYEEAKAFSDTDARKRGAARRRLEKRLLAVCRPYADDESAPRRKLCQRVERFIRELFVFVAEPYVPPDNNAAERSLRPLVVSRKISGGTRSDRGTASRMVLASLFGTWNAQGANPLLASHQI